ncbi:uncharacterized protein EV154DRAFT_417569 [Mucor mucedo]|uniref:uncharacterized protein n=1 Tax=Mucor mucedo TaxID=29922 RepID=UPI00221F42B8|nr:uncharacterized protein EV154DRAFT_417569 [Mucor mucedo]KAI7893090.1 hypothetical protein EV154DRAFT_417569 [Mucor mucedo]
MVPEEISTLFVVGFPENMQEREFQNMFMFSPGFEAATLKVPSVMMGVIEEDSRKQIIGFVRFRTRLDALDAKAILNGKRIDHEKGSVLKAELAKKNLHTKKELQQQTIKTPYEAFYSVHSNGNSGENSPCSPPHHHIIPTCTRSSSFPHNSRYSSKSLIDQFGIMGNKKASTIYPTTTLSSSSLASSSSSFVEHPFLLSKLYKTTSPPSHNDNQLTLSSTSTPTLDNPTEYYRIDQNPPCNTLYVGNLPMNTSQDELRSMFSSCPGFKRLSYKVKSNGPMCFVEFEDVPYATLALQEMHGNLLSNSINGGIRLSYSKNPLVRFTPITR